MDMLPIDPDKFEAWLKSLDQASEAGKRRNSCDCPLSRYLNTLHDEDVVVGIASTLIGDKHFTTPDWCQQFMQEIDGTDDDYERDADKWGEGEHQEPISAADCVSALYGLWWPAGTFTGSTT